MAVGDRLQGYSGRVREILKESGVEIGDEIEVEVRDETYRGILMARYELADPNYIVIKLPNGYNVGIRVEGEVKVKRIASAKKPRFLPPPKPKFKEGLPKVTIMSTGGTIASRID